MRLTDLKLGDKAIIQEIEGDIYIKKRLMEMGFIKGQEIHFVKEAPLKDPLEFKILESHVSLRRIDAKKVKVSKINLAKNSENFCKDYNLIKEISTNGKSSDIINIALIGNPNTGKTTIFNMLAGTKEKVANYSGVTVDIKETKIKIEEKKIRLIDLPGTYSLNSYSAEEKFVIDFLNNSDVDIIINVIDSTNLERNLYLTTMLLELGKKVIVTLNMFDELIENGNSINIEKLSKELNCTVIPTIGIKGEGKKELLQTIQKLANQKIDSLKLNFKVIAKSEEDITTERFNYIKQIIDKVLIKNPKIKETFSQKIDKLLTNRVFGFPIFLLFMWITFFATFNLGEYPMNWIEDTLAILSDLTKNLLPYGFISDLLVDGILQGGFAVLVFLPNILILYFFISLMEDTGYMPRAVFIMDKLMSKIGLNGKSFIPLLIGFGCNVPAILSSRMIENKKDRLVTMMINPFMSCSARLPVYVLFITAFFTSYRTLVLFSLYFTGILLAILSAILFKKTLFRTNTIPFIIELPPYRIPSFKIILKQVWFRGRIYLKKVGSTILFASLIIWALGYFPRDTKYSKNFDEKIEFLKKNPNKYNLAKIQLIELEKEAERQENSYIGKLGNFVQPIFEPLHFDWKMTVSIISGIAAKEVVVGTMAVLYQVQDKENTSSLAKKLTDQKYLSGPRVGTSTFNPLIALAFMVFVLIYFPCIGVVAAIKRESDTWKWALFNIIYTTSLAWLLSFVIIQIGQIFGF